MESPQQVSSDGWVAVEHLWEDLADAWFRPDAGGAVYLFRVPQDRLGPADGSPPLTVERLLMAAAIPADEVESWRLGDVPEREAVGADLGHPLPPLPPGATHLTVYVRVKPPAPATHPDGAGEVPPEQWQALDACWKAILGLEATVDALRLGMGGLGTDLEAAFRRPMTVEEKVHGLQSDVAQWNKGKSRIHYALPKLRDFVHRATWASAAPARKELEELVRDHVEPRVPFPRFSEVRDRLGHLQKDRQVLLAQGNAVSHECRGILAEVQRAYGQLQRNAAERARKERDARRTKGKYL